MTLSLIEGPSDGVKLVNANVPIFLGRGYEMGNVEIAKPYALYTFAIEDLLAGQPMTNARLTAWQYLIVSGENVLALAEVSAVSATGKDKLAFAALHPRSYAAAIADTIAAAEERPEVAEGAYELRVLRAPCVSLLAMWLHGADDLVLPLRDSRQNIAVTRSISISADGDIVKGEPALTEKLLPLAQVRLQAGMYKSTTAKVALSAMSNG
jgi:hypothetical protein